MASEVPTSELATSAGRHTKVRRAVIPAAGRGTRMSPFSLLLPKELVPLGSRPVLGFILEEAFLAGIRDVAIVLREGKETVRRYVDFLHESGELPGLSVSYIQQEEPTGLADALLGAQRFCAGEPFALLLPDNVLLSPDYRLDAMIRLYEEHGRDVFGVIEVGHRQADHFGNSGRFHGEESSPGLFEITRLRAKKAGPLMIAEGESIVRTCGRIVCHPRFFDVMAEVRPTVEGECSEVPAYRRIIAEHGALGCLLPAPLFDVGNPRGYLAASAWLYSQLSAAQ